ncbi:protein of unknown function [Candidatus Filomicrobium marinum]|nr:protein of unknown function [Candidatus Filomicrobium marinum]
MVACGGVGGVGFAVGVDVDSAVKAASVEACHKSFDFHVEAIRRKWLSLRARIILLSVGAEWRLN